MKRTLVLFAVAAMLTLPASAQVNVTYDANGFIGWWNVEAVYGYDFYAPGPYTPTGEAINTLSVGQSANVYLTLWGRDTLFGRFTLHDDGAGVYVTSTTKSLVGSVDGSGNVTIQLQNAPLNINLNGYGGGWGFDYSCVAQNSGKSLFSDGSALMPLEFYNAKFIVNNSGNAAFVSRDADGVVSVTGADWLITDGDSIAINPAKLVPVNVTVLDKITGEEVNGTFQFGHAYGFGVPWVEHTLGSDLLLLPGDYMIWFMAGLSDIISGVTIPADTRNWMKDIELSNGNILRFSDIPEPATMSLLALGGLALLRRRRRA